MKRPLIIGMAALGIFLVVSTGLWTFREGLFRWVALRYLTAHKISADFKVASLKTDHLRLENVSIEERSRISHLDVRFDWSKEGLGMLEALSLKAEALDLNELQQLSKKLSSPSSESAPLTYSVLKMQCDSARAMDIDLERH